VKRLAILGLIVAVVAVGLFMLAPRLVSGDIARDRIAERITELTGQPVRFDGDPVVALDTRLRITLGNVTIGESPAGGAPLIHMEALRGTVRLLPLLIGRVDIEEFELVRPRITVTIDEHGEASYGRVGGEVGGRLGDAERRSRGGGSPEPALEDLRIGRVLISDGTVTYRNAANDIDTEIDRINLEVGWPRTSGALSARGSFRWSGEAVEVNASLTSPMDLVAGGTSALRLSIDSAPLRLSFSGSADRLAKYQIRGDLTLATPSVRRAIAWAGTPMEDGATLGAGSLAATANLVGRTLSLSDTKLELDGNVGTGVLTADFGREEPVIQGTLDFASLDLSAYVEALRATIHANGRWIEAPLEPPWISGARLDLRLSAGTVIAGPARITNAGATAMLGNGRVSVNLADARFHGGRLQALVNVMVENGAVDLNARAGLEDVAAGSALAQLFGLDAVSGTGTVDAEATTGGRTWGELVAGLTGTLRATVTDGSIDGFEIGAIARALALPDSGGPIVTSRDTDFAEADIRVRFAGGQARTERFQVEGRGYRLRLDGWASLYRPTLSALAKLVVGEDANNALSFMVSGTWAAPVIEADPRPAQRLARTPAPLNRPPPVEDAALQ
jgi:AsmA protein